MKKGYKIVRRCGTGERVSLLGSMGGPTEWYPEYGIGIETRPREGSGPLAVFNSLSKASAYYCLEWDWFCELWECEYEPSDRVHPEGFLLWHAAGGESMTFPTDQAGVRAAGLPPGTAFAEIVRLTRRLQASGYEKRYGQGDPERETKGDDL
jgi:hypothetical protein